MMKHVLKRALSFALALVMVFSLFPAMETYVHAAGKLTVTDANIGLSWTDADGFGTATWSATGDTINCTVTGYTSWWVGQSSSTKLTITNNHDDERTLSFGWTFSGDGSVSLDVNPYSGKLQAGESLTITLNSGKGSSASSTLTLTNLKLLSSAEVTSTFLAPEHGSYTVDGVGIVAETKLKKSATESYSLSATPASGYMFFGWYSENTSSYVSYNATDSVFFDADPKLEPVFIPNTSALFGVGTATFFDLTEACNFANSSAASTKTVVLLNNGTVSGSHTIPAGITLLVPFNSANTLYTNKPDCTSGLANNVAWVKPTAYRTLTLASDASITVNGAISVSGQHAASNGGQKYCGAPTGPVGFVNMQSGSKITLNSGAYLYAWGFIQGSGTITAKSGATVYENFQFTDFRGGSNTTQIAGDGLVFPLNQYYVQNIEVPVTFYAGASEKVYTSAYASGMVLGGTAEFIGDNGMFKAESGATLTKDYIENRDRLQVDVSGNSALNSMVVKLSIEVNSANFVLPITNNVTININSGTTTLNQSVAMLPGTELNIAEGAVLNVAYSDTALNDYNTKGHNLIAYDYDEWTYGYNMDTGETATGLFAFPNKRLNPVAYAPGQTYTRTEANDLGDAIVNVNGKIIAEGYLYTTTSMQGLLSTEMGGAAIKSSEKTGSIVMTNGSGSDVLTFQANDGTALRIYMKSAALLNGDGSYLNTAIYKEDGSMIGSAAGTTYNYCATHDKWYTGECADCAAVKTLYIDGEDYEMNPGADLTELLAEVAADSAQDNWVHSGWKFYSDEACTTEVTLTDNKMPSYDLYAVSQWKYKIFWNGTQIGDAFAEGDDLSEILDSAYGDLDDGQEFKGWKFYKDSALTEEVELTNNKMPAYPLYLEIVTETKSYKIYFDVDGDSSVEGALDVTKSITHGTVPTAPTNYKADTAEWDYTFTGWKDTAGKVYTGELPAATGEMTYTAQYTAEKQEYTISWDTDGDGDVDDTTTVAYGAVPTHADGSKDATAEYTYTFKGWNPATVAVTGAAAYTAQFNATANSYKVVYKVNDEKVHEETVAYGETIPTYTYTAPGGYNFSGWDNVPATMPAKDVTVTGTTSLKSYTITWIVDGKSTITTVNHGDTPVYNGTPTKEKDAQYTYTFSGWTPEVVAATGNAAYTAQFTPVLRSYDITFKVDGQEDKIVSTKYGETPVYDANGKVPEKATDAKYSYTFAGWATTATGAVEELAKVNGEATYYAVFTKTPVEHTITFEIDGETFYQVKGGYGTTADYSELPSTEKTGYTFSGWDKELPTTIPAEDITITGSYTVNQYTITFKGDFNTEKDDTFADYTITKNYGEAITEADIAALNEALPTITGWEFMGWYYAEEVEIEGTKVWEHISEYAIPEAMLAESVTVYALWEKIPYVLTVMSSIDVDGEPITYSTMWYEESYEDVDDFNNINNFCYDAFCEEEGCDCLLPEGYTFEGYKYEDGTEMTFPIECWPAEDVTIIAQFEPIDYTITFMNGDSKYAEVTAAYGSEITLPTAPTATGYTFAGWVDAQGNAVALNTMPLNDATVYASWTVDSFKVNFFATEGDTTAVASFDVPYGTELTKEYVANLLAQVTAPTKTGYSWDGWNTDDVPTEMPAEAVNVYGTWTVNSHKVNYYVDGSLVHTDTVEYGKAIPEYTYTPAEGHSFAGWGEQVPATMPDNEVNVYGATGLISSTITFDVEGIEHITAKYGTAITWPESPTKDGHTFLGWSTDGENVIILPETMPADDLTLKAVWAKNTIYIIWNIDGKETTEEYKYGDTINVPEATKAADAQWTYKFTGWDVEPAATATVNTTYTAQFAKDEAVKYTVKFVDGETTVYETQVAWNGKVTLDGFTAPSKEGNSFSWTVDGNEVTFPYDMTTEEVTFVANWTPNNYTITVDGVVKEFTYGTEVSVAEPTKEGHNFNGWLKDGVAYTLPATMPAEDIVITSDWKVNSYKVTFNYVDENGASKSVEKTVEFGKAIEGITPDVYVLDGVTYTFNGWDTTVPETMPAKELVFNATYVKTGWWVEENGTTYLVKDEKVYFNDWTEIEEVKYYFDANSYIVKDITLIDGSYYAFDHDTGAFLADYTGIYEATNGDLYYGENGVAVANKGLVRVYVDGEAKYYYFGCAQTTDDSHQDNSCDAYKAQKDCVHWVEINYDLLPKWDYTFGKDGVIVHDDALNNNEEQTHKVVTYDGVKYYTIDGVKVHYGLFVENGYYYYARSDGSLVAGRDYWISDSHLNGVERNGEPVEEGSYTFDADGKIVWGVPKNGIVEEDGSLFYYENDVRVYAGLINLGTEEEPVYYYVRTNGELVHGRSYWITKTNGLKEPATYEFDKDGKMILNDGFVTKDGVLYYYRAGLPFYAGLIEVEGSYYYVRTSGEVVCGKDYWVTKHNSLLPEGLYTFGKDGKMINAPENAIPEVEDTFTGVKNGYYFVAGQLVCGAGLVEWNGSYYYVRSNGAVATGDYWISRHNGLLPEGLYSFDTEGKMVNPPVMPDVEENFTGVQAGYYYENGQIVAGAGLIEWNGNYYYVRSNGQLATGQYYITNTNELGFEKGIYTFNSEGAMVV